MRLLFPIAAGIAATASAQPAVAPIPPADAPRTVAAGDCPDMMEHFAKRGGMWPSDPLKPRNLSELPPAETFAAVYRMDERGCMVPVLYRDIPGR